VTSVPAPSDPPDVPLLPSWPSLLTGPTAAYYASFIALGLVVASLGPTIPGLAALTGAALSGVSTVFLARSGGYLTGALFGGRLYDGHRGHPLLCGALLLMAAGMACVPFASGLPSLGFILFLVGLGEGTMDVGANALLLWTHPRDTGPWMNALHGFYGLGAFISPLIVGGALLIDGTIAYPYWITAALVLPPAVWIACLPSPTDPHASASSSGDRANGRLILLVALLFFSIVGAEVGFGNWIYTYALRGGLVDPDGAALLTSLFWGAFTAGRLLGIPLAARFDPVTILLADFGGIALGAACLLAFPESETALWAGTVVAGLSVASQFATVLALAGSAIRITGRVTGWFFVGSSSGAMVVPWLIGQCFDRFTPRATFAIILADVALGLLLFAVFLRASRSRQPA
jgi:FHS family Na+ dependent glucose MFS transporter 1